MKVATMKLGHPTDNRPEPVASPPTVRSVQVSKPTRNQPVQVANITMIRPLPVTVMLLQSDDLDLTPTILKELCDKGHHTRSHINPNETVASYARKHVMNNPDWLNSIIYEKITTQNRRYDHDVLIRFGHGENVTVKFRNECNANNRKKICFLSFTINLFLAEEDDGSTGLNPQDNLYTILQYKGFSQVRICPRTTGSEDNNETEIELSDTTITFIIEGKKLLRVVLGDKEVVERAVISSEKTNYTNGSDDVPFVSPSKKKAKKDPNAPKVPKSPYLLFYAAAYPDIKQKNPKGNMGDVSRSVSLQWKDLNAEEKKKYNELAQKDKSRYEEELKKYVQLDTKKALP